MNTDYASLTYPPYESPLRTAYGSRYPTLYVLLHPFFDLPDELTMMLNPAPGKYNYPSPQQIISQALTRTWRAVAASCDIGTLSGMNRALLTSIGALRREFEDQSLADKLCAHMDQSCTWPPSEGQFEPLLQTFIVDVLRFHRVQRVIHVPEFPSSDPTLTISISDLADRVGGSFPDRGTLVSENLEFLFTVEWDSFFTLLYCDHNITDLRARIQVPDGFIAPDNLMHNWWSQSIPFPSSNHHG